MNYINENFGKRVRILRDIKGDTQDKLGEKIALSTKQVGVVERGLSFVSSPVLTNMCEYFEKSPRFFFNFSKYTHSKEKEDVIKDIELLLDELDVPTLIKYRNVLMTLEDLSFDIDNV